MQETWVGKIPWRRAWKPTPVPLPGESQGHKSLASHSPWGHRVRYSWTTKHNTAQHFGPEVILLEETTRFTVEIHTLRAGLSSVSFSLPPLSFSSFSTAPSLPLRKSDHARSLLCLLFLWVCYPVGSRSTWRAKEQDPQPCTHLVP